MPGVNAAPSSELFACTSSSPCSTTLWMRTSVPGSANAIASPTASPVVSNVAATRAPRRPLASHAATTARSMRAACSAPTAAGSPCCHSPTLASTLPRQATSASCVSGDSPRTVIGPAIRSAPGTTRRCNTPSTICAVTSAAGNPSSWYRVASRLATTRAAASSSGRASAFATSSCRNSCAAIASRWAAEQPSISIARSTRPTDGACASADAPVTSKATSQGITTFLP